MNVIDISVETLLETQKELGIIFADVVYVKSDIVQVSTPDHYLYSILWEKLTKNEEN